MALEIKLGQKLSQSLVMTPQLQQAIKLLQLGRMEYLEVIEKELLENPLLESISDSADSADEEVDYSEQESSPLVSATESVDSLLEFSVESEDLQQHDTPVESAPENDWNQISFDDVEYSSSSSVSKSTSDFDDSRPSLENSISSPEGLTSHLLWQLRTSDLHEGDQEIASHIIGNLDRNGYLACSLPELSEMCGRSEREVHRVLRIVQTLDPVGIAARDLRECLSIQLEQQGQGSSLAQRIVQEHLTKLELRKYEVIAKEESVELEAVFEAIRLIQTLEPRPGRPFVDESPVYITPDIYVRKVGDQFVISLNENGVPRLRLNRKYQDLTQNGNGEVAADRTYLLECMKSASWLLKSIQQRQQTIFKVTSSIMKYQHEFLEKGVAGLRPLVLRDIAADVGMHESTVSRVTTNKYVHTPQGVYELKFFFSSGLKSGYGEVSSESVKEQIRDLIAAENPKRPLSDQAIVEALKAQGVDIARRTVAKYREAIGALSSARRKKVF